MKLLSLASLLVLSAVAGTAVARERARRAGRSSAPPDRARLEERHAHHEALTTYQDLLDESLQLTFPASDPICAHAATRCADACETPSNGADWRLHPGSRERTSAAS